MQVVHAQGDGWVRGYEALSGKKLWEFDTNPKESVWPKTRNEVISTPVIFENVVYISNGQDPEHGEGVGHAYAIDATKRGDITQSGRLWHFEKIRRSISTAAIKDGLIYLADFSGFLHCLDLKTGKPYWTHDMFAAIWGSPIIIDDKVYLGDEDGDITVLQHGKRTEGGGRAEHGQLGVFDRRAGQRRALRHEPQSALRARRGSDVEEAQSGKLNAAQGRLECLKPLSALGTGNWKLETDKLLSMDRRSFLTGLAAGVWRCRGCRWPRAVHRRRPPTRGRSSAARRR